MNLLKITTSFLLIGFSVVVFLASLKFGFGDLQNPGPGFMALLCSVLLFSLSLVVLITDLTRLKKKNKDDQEEMKVPIVNWEHLKKPIILVVALAVYALIIEGIGFVIATFLLTFVMIVTFESKKWYKDLLIAALVASISFIIFDRWLQVRLPPGLLVM